MLNKYDLDQFILEISTANVRIEITLMNDKVLSFNDFSSLEMFKEKQSEKLSLACWAFIAKMKVEHPDNYFSVISRELENIKEKQKQLFISSPNGGVYRKEMNIFYEGKPGVRLDELEKHFLHDINSFVNVQYDNLTMARSVLKVSMDNHKGLKPLFKGECIRCTNQNLTPPTQEITKFRNPKDQTKFIRVMYILRRLGIVKLTGDNQSRQKFFETLRWMFSIDPNVDCNTPVLKIVELQDAKNYLKNLTGALLDIRDEIYKNRDEKEK